MVTHSPERSDVLSNAQVNTGLEMESGVYMKPMKSKRSYSQDLIVHKPVSMML